MLVGSVHKLVGKSKLQNKVPTYWDTSMNAHTWED